ncbi:MAG: hypothetical protein SVR08_11865 [Spirochaetota bacterium]|nr:hypothetical protein [Spirochaetota bacterium]
MREFDYRKVADLLSKYELTLGGAGVLLHIRPQTIHRWIHAQTDKRVAPKMHHLLTLCNYFNVDMNYFFPNRTTPDEAKEIAARKKILKGNIGAKARTKERAAKNRWPGT